MSAIHHAPEASDVERPEQRPCHRLMLTQMVLLMAVLLAWGCTEEGLIASPTDAEAETQQHTLAESLAVVEPAAAKVTLAMQAASAASIAPTSDALTHWAALELEDLFLSDPSIAKVLDQRAPALCNPASDLPCDTFQTLPSNAQHQMTWSACGSGAPATYVAGQFEQAFPIHGVAGDHAVLFAVQQSAGIDTTPTIHAMRRLDGRPLGEVTAPPEGWGVPLSPFLLSFERTGAISSRGEFIVTDVRIPPAQAFVAPEPAHLYRYSYTYSPFRGLRTQLVSTSTLPANTVPPGQGLPNGIVYLGSITSLPSGHVLATDTLVGSIWVAPDPSGPWTMTLIDPRFSPAPAPNLTGVQRAPGGGLRPYNLILPAPPGSPTGIGPGIESITYAAVTDEVCVSSNAQGGIFCIPRPVLLDTATPPFFKAPAIREVLPPSPGLTDFSDGLAHDRFHPSSPWLYWHRAPSDATSFDGSGFNTLRRVNLLTGELEVIAKTNTCFDWTFEIAPLPPLVPNSPFTSILSSLGQGPNDPALNMSLMGQISYVAPSLMPITLATSW